MLNQGANIHSNDDEAFKEAAWKGHLEIVKFLIENGANIHAANYYVLRSSATNGHLEIVKFLVLSDIGA